MQTPVLLTPVIFCLFWVATPQIFAQDSAALPRAQELKIRERTILAQFESNLVEPADKRLQKKLARHELILKRRSIIDTLEISEYRRKRLLKELYHSPHSLRWERVLSKLEIEEDSDQ